MNGRVAGLLVVPSILAVLAGGCSPGADLETRVPVPTSSLAAAPSAAPPAVSAAPSASSTTVRVYFYLGGEPGSEGLVPVERHVAADHPMSSAMTAMLAGPTSAEAGGRTYTSAVPVGTRLLDLWTANGVATIDLSREFESGGGSQSMFVRLGQVVFTLTQFADVRGVVFEIEGKRVTSFSGEGIVLDRPQTRADSVGMLPAIFVDAPTYRGALGNPGHVTGTADVFEAQFRVTLIDATGTTIADVPVTASCGTGCRGTFDATIPYSVKAAQAGTLRVWDGSMKDGRPVNVREYPVGLVPAG